MEQRPRPVFFIILWSFPFILLVGLLMGKGQFVESTHREMDNTLFGQIDNTLSQVIPFSRSLRRMGIEIRYTTGEVLQQETFLSPKGLMRNLPPVNEDTRRTNTTALIKLADYAEDSSRIYLTIIPNSSAILQQNMPQVSPIINQRNLMENIYNQLTGKLITINVYNNLLENQQKYIYYRTEDQLTALGGYHIYQELVGRMLEQGEVIPFKGFRIAYGREPFYGELYKETPFKKVEGDILMFYEYGETPAYLVVNENGGDVRQQESLYDKNKSTLDSYLAGCKGVTTISSSSRSTLRLLVVGDNSMVSSLPFLANHYAEITAVNLYEGEANIGGIDLDEYDQVLILVGIENYTQNTGLAETLNRMMEKSE